MLTDFCGVRVVCLGCKDPGKSEMCLQQVAKTMGHARSLCDR